MVWAIAGGFFSALYVPYCLNELDLSTSTFGVIVAMGGVGSLGGALVSRWLVGTIGLGRTLMVTSALSLACALFIPLAHGSFAMIVAFLVAHQALGDGFAVAFLIQAVTLRQTVLPKRVLGRANAAIHMATMGLLAIAAVAAGAVGELVGLRNAVWIGVLIGLAAPLFLIPIVRLKAMPPPASS
jgi:MFS family permease